MLFTALALVVSVNAATLPPKKETPPREPPYTDVETAAEPAKPETQTETKTGLQTPNSELPTAQGANDLEPGSKYIHHPGAKKGLTRISKEGEYYYKVKPSPQRFAGTLLVGSMSPPALKNETSGATYRDIYGDKSSVTLITAYEWHFLKTAVGKVGLKAGTGIIYAQGYGRFANNYSENIGKIPKEKFTLLGLPNQAGIVYRMQFWDKQPLIPYGEAGADYYVFAEDRNDKKPMLFAGAPGTHVAAGVGFSFNWFDKLNMSRLDQEYGINNVMLVGEFRRVIGLKSDLDISANIISAGLLAEF